MENLLEYYISHTSPLPQIGNNLWQILSKAFFLPQLKNHRFYSSLYKQCNLSPLLNLPAASGSYSAPHTS